MAKTDPIYYVRFVEHTYQIEAPDPSNEPYTFTGSYGLDVQITGLYKTPTEGMNIEQLSQYDAEALYGFDDLEVGNTAHVVVVSYTTGDTFGSSGAWKIAAIKEDIADAIKARTKVYQPMKEGDRYRPWDGYFEHLDGVEIVPLLVQ